MSNKTEYTDIIAKKLLKNVQFTIQDKSIKDAYSCKKCGKECTIEPEVDKIEPHDRDYLCELCCKEKINDLCSLIMEKIN